MTNAHETAFLRLKLELAEQELIAIYTPSRQEIEHVFAQYRQASHRTFLLIQLKLLHRLDYFVSLSTVPAVVVRHICEHSEPWRNMTNLGAKRHTNAVFDG